MLYEVILQRSGADPSEEESTVFRTVVEADSLDAAAIEGVQAFRREFVGPLSGPKLVVNVRAMGAEEGVET
jgi:hypothetical protein